MKITIIFLLVFYSATSYGQLETIPSAAYKWADFPVEIKDDRETRKILEGISPHFSYLEMHATTQFKGAKASTAHANEDIEELIIVKEGEMKVTIEDKSWVLGPQGIILLMPQQMHSLENIGDGPLTYYVMRYRSKKPMDIKRGQKEGGSLVLNVDSLTYVEREDGKKGGTAYFDRPTAMCERFEMHTTQLNQKGPSHDPHKHEETEIILMISGETEMMINGEKYQAKAGDFYFACSDEMHGISNASNHPCLYFAFKWK